jgi:hypothetical protein
MLGRFRSNFQTNCWVVDLKRTLWPFYSCKLDLMGHRWPEVMAIKVWGTFLGSNLTQVPRNEKALAPRGAWLRQKSCQEISCSRSVGIKEVCFV